MAKSEQPPGDLSGLIDIAADFKVLYVNGSTVVFGNSTGQELECSNGCNLTKAEAEIIKVFQLLDIKDQVKFMNQIMDMERQLENKESR